MLAERSDGLYEHQAAIKLLSGFSGEAALAQLAHERQVLAVARHRPQARLDVLQQLGVARRRALEDAQAADVHVGVALLHIKESGVECAQSFVPGQAAHFVILPLFTIPLFPARGHRLSSRLCYLQAPDFKGGFQCLTPPSDSSGVGLPF
jgi:hypothetical protein